MQKQLTLLVFLASLTILAGCVSEPARTGARKLTVAVIPMGTTDEYWRTVHAGAARAGRDLDVQILWQGPIRRDDRSAQIDVVENMIVRGVQGIVLAPVDNMALRGSVEDAYRNRIPVVVIDSDLQSDRLVSFIATDNYKGGYMAGEHLSGLLGGKGAVAMLRGVEGNASTDHRERGFLDAISKSPIIRVVSENQHGGSTSESAYRASENLLAPFKTSDGQISIQGIFCPNESTAFGMLRALQDADLAGKVHFVGFDSSDKLTRALEVGQIDALIVQNPMRIAYLGVKTLVDHISGNTVPARVDVAAMVVTRDNMQKPQIAELLHPNISRWIDE